MYLIDLNVSTFNVTNEKVKFHFFVLSKFFWRCCRQNKKYLTSKLNKSKIMAVFVVVCSLYIRLWFVFYSCRYQMIIDLRSVLNLNFFFFKKKKVNLVYLFLSTTCEYVEYWPKKSRSRAFQNCTSLICTFTTSYRNLIANIVQIKCFA